MILVFLAYGMGITLLFTGAVEGHFGNLAQAYKKYGFSHCFVSSVLDRELRNQEIILKNIWIHLRMILIMLMLKRVKRLLILYLSNWSLFDPTCKRNNFIRESA